uniref:Uncharacterized protein n=1 Tax=Rhizophora mucronata TaxID=61149 RepID=A0A2P2Q589_RHIMU
MVGCILLSTEKTPQIKLVTKYKSCTVDSKTLTNNSALN